MEKDNWDPEFIKRSKANDKKRKKQLAEKKKVILRKRIRAIFVLVLLPIIAGLVIKSFTSNETFDSKDSFIKFVKEKIKQEGNANIEKLDTSYNYDKYSSNAISMPNINSNIQKECKKYITSKEEAFKKQEKNEGNAHVYLVSEAYKFEGMKCVDVKLLRFKKEKDSIKEVGTSVKTLCFNANSNRALSRFSIYRQDYKVNIKKALLNALKGYENPNYKMEDIMSDGNNFDIAFSKAGDINLYFDKGSYIKGGEGIVKISLPKNILRKDIRARELDPAKPMLALTYDDGPSYYTGRLIKLFERENAACTLFQLGINIESKDPSHKILKNAVSNGIELASHSYSHPNLLTLKKKGVLEQKNKTDRAFKKAVGFVPRLYRPPYGAGNVRTTKLFDKSAIFWSIDTCDWKYRSVKHFVKFINAQKKLANSVVLMHDIHKSTVEASMKVVPSLKKKGYQPVTISELLEYKYGIDPEKTRHFSYSFFKRK